MSSDENFSFRQIAWFFDNIRLILTLSNNKGEQPMKKIFATLLCTSLLFTALNSSCAIAEETAETTPSAILVCEEDDLPFAHAAI